MTEVHLDATDAMELAEILLFVRNWLARDSHAWSRLMRWTRAKYAGKHPLGMTCVPRNSAGLEILAG